MIDLNPETSPRPVGETLRFRFDLNPYPSTPKGPRMKLETRKGLTTLETRMTLEQARRYGDRHMPKDLKRAGFQTVVYRATTDINGWNGYRINYGR